MLKMLSKLLYSNSYRNNNISKTSSKNIDKNHNNDIKKLKYRKKLCHFYVITIVILILILPIEFTLGSRKFLTGLIIGTLLGA